MRCFLFSRLLRHISLTILIGLVIGLFIGYIRIIESSSNTELKSPHLIVRSSKLTAVESNPNLSDRSIPEMVIKMNKPTKLV
ncbi:hypothetical protein HDE_00701 [Halotydeus destructor]|nr:hypothetical protein HDE_00701 [Halotydeus destructor]